jgi:hypothetical protein
MSRALTMLRDARVLVFTQPDTTIVAADFLTGNSPSHARMFDRKCTELARLERHEDEELTTFRRGPAPRQGASLARPT